jgi:hypothetical protein
MVSEAVAEIIIPGTNQKDFFKFLLDKNFLAFESKFVGLKVLEVVKQEGDDKHVKMRLREIPEQAAPSALLWYLGKDELEYHVDEVIDVEKCLITFKVIPPVLTEYVIITGTIQILKVDDETCKQIMKTSLKLDFFGGSLLESTIVGHLNGSLDRIPECVDAWKKKHPK